MIFLLEQTHLLSSSTRPINPVKENKCNLGLACGYPVSVYFGFVKNLDLEGHQHFQWCPDIKYTVKKSI